MKALVFEHFGAPEVLEYREVGNPVLQPGEILVSLQSIGLNYADIYRRTGRFSPKGTPPFINGFEGAGVVADANNQAGFKVGDRIAFADVPFANAEQVCVPVTHAIPLPHDISFDTAAAILLQGLTADYLTTDSHEVREGETLLIHAASGGVGQILTQICKLKRATVIGLTTSREKEPIVRQAGVDAVFNLKGDWKREVMVFTEGKGVDVVYDSVGSTVVDSLEVTRARGKVVFYGMSGGEPAAVDPRLLMSNSKTLTGGDLWSHLTSREERIKRATKLFNWVRKADIKIPLPSKFHLSEGAKAHHFLESGQSTGKILLVPDRKT